MKRKFLTVLSLLLVCALVFGACANRPDVPAEPEATATPEPTPDAPLVNPLTGETATKDYSKTRPVAIMVENNHWDAPITPIQQGSISKAAIVYEAQVEQITRNMFIFMDLDDVDNITPIRSCRSYFVSTALSYDAPTAASAPTVSNTPRRCSRILWTTTISTSTRITARASASRSTRTPAAYTA